MTKHASIVYDVQARVHEILTYGPLCLLAGLHLIEFMSPAHLFMELVPLVVSTEVSARLGWRHVPVFSLSLLSSFFLHVHFFLMWECTLLAHLLSSDFLSVHNFPFGSSNSSFIKKWCNFVTWPGMIVFVFNALFSVCLELVASFGDWGQVQLGTYLCKAVQLQAANGPFDPHCHGWPWYWAGPI